MNISTGLHVVCLYIYRSVSEGVITQCPYSTVSEILWLILFTLQVAQDQSKAFVKLTGKMVLSC